MRIPATLSAALVFGAATLPAQRAHQFELGAVATYTRYDPTFGLENRLGAGGRVGYLFSEHIGIEVDAGFASLVAGTAPGGADLAHGSASLVLNLPVGSRQLFFLLAGYSRLDFEPTAPYRFTDDAIHVGLGDRIFLTPRLALRLEARGLYAPSTRAPFGGAWAGHVQGAVGLSLFTGRGPDTDADSDGIPNRQDACAATPTSAVVDPRGCPTDSDGDNVYNGLDVCPNTPAGVGVNQDGCPLDSDADGVYDGVDQCPATAKGLAVDGQGCPEDGDGDTVADGTDLCPATAAGAAVDATGCPLDTDGDHVPDGIDRCPNTRAGAEVDAVGCPIARDSDKDGVDDPRDRCPNTETATQVDAAGCPILFTEERTAVVLRGVTFETGRSALRPDSYTVLDIVAASLVANPDIRIEIAGHTDDVGPDAVNARLSQARAAAVRAYLASKGVAPARMTAQGYGEAQPAATNATPEGRAQNRRVELRQIP